MKRIYVLYFSLVLTGLVSLKAQEGFQAQIQDVLNEHIKDHKERPVHSILLYARQGEQIFHGVAGSADGKGASISPDFQFKIASVGKTFTAIIVLQMMEEGLIDLDAPAMDYLGRLDYVQMDSIHILEGKAYGKEITVKNLIQHRSGIADIFFDKFPDFMAHWQADPMYQWSPKSLFEYFYSKDLHHGAHFIPGEGFHYSDVNFFLLGLIIEQVSGKSLADNCRERIQDPLGMDDTYLEYYEDPVGNGKMAHAFFGLQNITETANTSFDWSGGGQVSTTKDLSKLIEGLISGKLFKHSETLDMMMAVEKAAKSFDYGMGFLKMDINGIDYYGHSGFWGVMMLHAPAKDRTVCLTVNQVTPPYSLGALMSKIDKALDSAK